MESLLTLPDHIRQAVEEARERTGDSSILVRCEEKRWHIERHGGEVVAADLRMDTIVPAIEALL